MTKLRLPIGIQTFRKIREGREYYYVDKTPWIVALIDQGSHFLLSRPRRFGKSLFLDTLKELFEGNEELFKGLHIHNLWDWSERWPVLRLSFEGGDFKEPGHLHANLMAQLDSAARSAGVAAEYNTGPERFARLLETLSRASGRRVVVLVDEYDKPILDALQSPEVAQANGAYLRGLYGVVKDRQKHIRFSFLTGVSKFSMANQFSGLNSLRDVSLDPRHAAICGFTESDLDEVFAAELPGLNRHRVRDWYNGYSWRGEEKIYNPFDVLLLFDSREFKAHWFETGSQKFLLDTLKERGLAGPDLARMTGTDELLLAVRLGRHGPGGSAVPDWLSHDSRGATPRRKEVLPPRLSESRGQTESGMNILLTAMGRCCFPKGRSRHPRTSRAARRGTTWPVLRRSSGRSSPAFPTSGT